LIGTTVAPDSEILGVLAGDLVHLLAELMDNATKFSAPSEEVHVYVEDLHNGAVITIEDGAAGGEGGAAGGGHGGSGSSAKRRLRKR